LNVIACNVPNDHHVIRVPSETSSAVKALRHPVPRANVTSAVATYTSISDRERSCNRRCATAQDDEQNVFVSEFQILRDGAG
jgi:hypothetical protein